MPDFRLFYELAYASNPADWLPSAYIHFKASQNSTGTLVDYLQTAFGIDCSSLSYESERDTFDRCLKRHVALFYGDYVSEHESPISRPFPIPQCDYLGFPFEGKRTETSSDDEDMMMASGSQSTVYMKPVMYGGQSVSFLVKSFKAREPNTTNKRPTKERQENRQKTPRSPRLDDRGPYYREMDAYTHLPSESTYFPHPVCFWDSEQAILYPYYGGGDLVPLNTDDDILDRLDAVIFKKIARQLIEAVHLMHEAGLTHLDLKPENVLIGGRSEQSRSHFFLDPERERPTLKIIDFGLCIRNVDFAGLGCPHVGTRTTMSPEQHLCHRPLSPASDWWGVGATLFRTRVMWDPSLEDGEERDGLLGMRDPYWRHPVMGWVEEFGEEWGELMERLLQVYPKDRRFDDDMARLWSLKFFQQ
jgi:hypothetical protein